MNAYEIKIRIAGRVFNYQVNAYSESQAERMAEDIASDNFAYEPDSIEINEI